MIPIISLFFSIVLYSLSFPSLFFAKGFFLFGWLCYIPLFYSIKFLSRFKAFLFGIVYGLIAFSLLCFWLYGYDVFCAVGVSLYLALFHGVLFFFLKLVDRTRIGFIFQAVVFLFFEMFRTCGFLGFSYGIIGYSQYEISSFIRTADLFGVWGISFAVYLFSSLAAVILTEIVESRECVTVFKRHFVEELSVVLLVLLLFFLGSFRKTVENSRFLKVALIQPNTDPWKEGVEAYEEDLKLLIELTEKAFEKDPDIQLVVWPETAVVPDIMFYSQSNVEPRRHALVERLLEYCSSKKCSFVIGNNYSQMDGEEISSYNSAVYLSKNGETSALEAEIYNKIHLVPFSEYFPFEKIMPDLYNKLIEDGSHFWTPGKDIKIFECDGVRFSTPICFEDTFSQITAQMKNAGSQLIVNLSNDSWSHSLSCQNQHLAMAAFRSAENRIPSVRSTCSGQTCVIDSEGRIIEELEPFTEDVLVFNVSIR